MGWKMGEPPKDELKPVRLRYQDEFTGNIQTGLFVWSKVEDAWIECNNYDGIGLYKEDGWKVLGWKERGGREKAGSKKDIIVTTPKNQMKTAALEAQNCREAIEAGEEAFYFRTFRSKPRHLNIGSRIFYVEDGYVRGFGTVSEIIYGDMQCDTTGYDYGDGHHAIMPAQSWKWIKPIPMKGFQGWRYFEKNKVKVIGEWKDPKPEIK